MSDIRTIRHSETGDYIHLKDFLTHVLEERNGWAQLGERSAASALDRLIVNVAAPFMIEDGFRPTGPIPTEDVTDTEAVSLHTEPEQGDADE